MNIHVFQDTQRVATAAATVGADAIRAALESQGEATVVLASAASQIEMLSRLVQEPNIAWNTVSLFHLDEYVGLPVNHPASFRLFLWERFLKQLPLPPREYCLLDGESDPVAECARAGELIRRREVDVAFIGIGENCHVAFNDPPADFTTTDPYLVVELDEPCRRQQVDEGWFSSLDEVPRQAISMSVRQILSSRKIVCTAPDERKATAIRAAVQGPVTPNAPASCLQNHSQVELLIDQAAASQLSVKSLSGCMKHD